MAEGLAIAGSVVTVLNLIKYSSACVERVYDFRRHKKDYPQAFKNLQIALPFIATTLEKVKLKAESGVLDSEESKNIQVLLKSCEARVTELNEIFRKYLPTEKDGGWDRFSKAIRSVNQDEKVHDIAAEIMQAVQLFTLHTASAQPSAEEISAIVTSDLESSIDKRIQSVVQTLREHSSNSTAITNNNLSRQTIYNGQTHIYNNYFFNVTDSRLIEHVGTSQTRIEGPAPTRNIEGSAPLKMITNDSESHPTFNLENAMKAFAPFEGSGVFQSSPNKRQSTTLRYSEPVLTINGHPNRNSAFGEKEAFQEDLPEVARASSFRYQSYTTGFVEPIDSTTSLATTLSSNSSVRSPPLPASLRAPSPARRTPTPEPPRPAPPPRDGYFELDGGASGIAITPRTSISSPPVANSPYLAASHHPHHLRHQRSFDSTTSTQAPAPSTVSADSAHSSDATGFSCLSGSTTAPETVDSLSLAASYLRQASSLVSSDPSAAKRLYYDAIRAYASAPTRDERTGLRRLRSLVAAELGLSLVVADAMKHVGRAQRYADEAGRAAESQGSQGERWGVRMDHGNIKAREAKVTEKGGGSSVTVNSITAEAWSEFESVVAEVGGLWVDSRGKKVSIDDCNTAAQALLGCARCSRRLVGVNIGEGRRVGDKYEYAREADLWVERGLSKGRDYEARERLLETKEMVKNMLR